MSLKEQKAYTLERIEKGLTSKWDLWYLKLVYFREDYLFKIIHDKKFRPDLYQ